MSPDIRKNAKMIMAAILGVLLEWIVDKVSEETSDVDKEWIDGSDFVPIL